MALPTTGFTVNQVIYSVTLGEAGGSIPIVVQSSWNDNDPFSDVIDALDVQLPLLAAALEEVDGVGTVTVYKNYEGASEQEILTTP